MSAKAKSSALYWLICAAGFFAANSAFESGWAVFGAYVLVLPVAWSASYFAWRDERQAELRAKDETTR